MSVSPTNENTRRGNRVLHSRLPVSLRHCPSLPSATACGHRQWDWALPHSSRKQQTHFTWMHIIQEKQKASWANRVFYATPGADLHSISNRSTKLSKSTKIRDGMSTFHNLAQDDALSRFLPISGRTGSLQHFAIRVILNLASRLILGRTCSTSMSLQK